MTLARTKPRAQPAPLEVTPVSAHIPTDIDEVTLKLRQLRRNSLACNFIACRLLQHVRDNRRFQQAGFPSMLAYFQHVFPGKSESTLRRALRFADSIPVEVAAEYEPDVIEAGVKLLGRTSRKAVVISKPSLEAIQVRTTRDGKPATVKFAQATAEELEEELRLRRLRKAPPRSPEAERSLKSIEECLGDGDEKLAQVRFQRFGSELRGIIEIPADKLPRVAEFLRAARRVKSSRRR